MLMRALRHLRTASRTKAFARLGDGDAKRRGDIRGAHRRNAIAVWHGTLDTAQWSTTQRDSTLPRLETIAERIGETSSASGARLGAFTARETNYLALDLR
jgi:hypothetical protein